MKFLAHKTVILLLISLLGLGSFYMFSRMIKRGFLKTTDTVVTMRLQEKIDGSAHLRAAEFVGNLMEGSTFFASPEFTVIATLVLTGVAFFLRKKHKWLAVAIPVGLVLLVGGELIGKTMVHHPSPPFSMIKNPTTFFPGDYINEQFSYPSGHAARAVFLAIVAGSLFVFTPVRKKAGIIGGVLLLGYVAMVAISRIYLGHHWFSDILGGSLLGGSLGLFAVLW